MPAITVRCPGCRRRLSAPERAAGRTLRCPNCGNPVTVVADLDATVVDGTAAPDFSYLRTADDSDEDILLADAGDDRESALGQSTARRPAQSTKVGGPPPPPLVYTPPPVGANGPPVGDNPFAHLADSGPTPPAEPRRKAPGTPAPAPTPAPTPPVAVRTPTWVWAVVVALAVYAAVATGVAVWGWLRPH